MFHDDYWLYDEDKEDYLIRDVDVSKCGSWYSDEDCKNCSHKYGCSYYKDR